MKALALACAIAATAALAAQGPSKYVPARTPWGDPDLQGTYTDKDENDIPMEKPGQFQGKSLEQVDDSELADIVRERQAHAVETAPGIGGAGTGAGPVHWYEHFGEKNSRAWLISDPSDGRIPAMTPAAQARAAAWTAARRAHGPYDSYEDRGLYERCITRGVVGSMLPGIYGSSYQVVQGPGFVAILDEMIHETRVVPLGNRPHVGAALRSYMGDPRGRFDGTTLVVETTNFTDRTAIGFYGNGTPHSDRLRLLERFTPTSRRTLEWTVTVDDPGTWVRPWTFGLQLTKDPTQQVFEYACHEGNYAMSNMLRAARLDDRR